MAFHDQLNTPFYAVVGAGDLAVQKLRGAKLDVDVKTVPENARAAAQARVAGLRAAADRTASDVRSLPERLSGLPEKAQGVAIAQLHTAGTVYADLATRGEGLVARIRRQKATQDMAKAGQQTVTSAKATSTTAKKAAKNTTSRAKSTTTSAKKTASAAQKATGDAAGKVGN